MTIFFNDESCPHCGVDITEELEEEYLSDSAIDDFEFICSKCGGSIEVDVVFEDPTFYLKAKEKEANHERL